MNKDTSDMSTEEIIGYIDGFREREKKLGQSIPGPQIEFLDIIKSLLKRIQGLERLAKGRWNCND